MKTISADEYQKKYGTEAYVNLFKTSAPQEQQPGFIQRVKNDINQAGDKAYAALTGKGEFAGKSTLNRATGAVAAGFNAVPQVASETLPQPVRQGLNKVGEVASGAVNFVANNAGKNPFSFGKAPNQSLTEDPRFQNFANSKAGQTTADVAGTLSNTGQIAGDILAIDQGAKGLQKGLDVTKQGVQKSGQMLNQVQGEAQGYIQKAKDFSKGNMILEEAKRIPDRMKANIAKRQATQETINQLPTETARRAAQDGIDPIDVKTLYSLDKTQKAPLKKLAQVTKDFAEGKTKTNPIEVVGKPIVSRLKELEKLRSNVGAKLGEVSKQLGTISKEELVPTIFGKLKKVPGLEGLTIGDNGALNFKNTVLTTIETKADRLAIQRIFDSATKWGSGESKHLLRQELFEALGGKKRANLNLTATQEKAYQAVRQGLSDVLESKNSTYKSLSNQYRKVITPLQDMRKMLRTSATGVEGDVLDMSAGLLARRLTSLAQSNPQIRGILNAMDKATAVAGKTRLSVESLQDFYNILEKYYDIAPKTGFQAQITQGIEKAAGGPLNYIAEQVKGLAGETPAVRQAALEKILKEVLGD